LPLYLCVNLVLNLRHQVIGAVVLSDPWLYRAERSVYTYPVLFPTYATLLLSKSDILVCIELLGNLVRRLSILFAVGSLLSIIRMTHPFLHTSQNGRRNRATFWGVATLSIPRSARFPGSASRTWTPMHSGSSHQRLCAKTTAMFGGYRVTRTIGTFPNESSHISRRNAGTSFEHVSRLT